MNSHKGKRLFITGIPTSGKSYLAEKLAKEVSGIAIMLDNYRKDFAKEEKYRKWTNFLFDKNEYEYLTKTTPGKLWKNLVAQSEGLWPAFSQEIKRTKMKKNPWYLNASIYSRILQNNIWISLVLFSLENPMKKFSKEINKLLVGEILRNYKNWKQGGFLKLSDLITRRKQKNISTRYLNLRTKHSKKHFNFSWRAN